MRLGSGPQTTSRARSSGSRRRRMRRESNRSVAVCALGAIALLVCVDGRAAAQMKLPRTPDGKPDLQGIWQAVNAAGWDLRDHVGRLGAPAGLSVIDGGEIPYQSWARDKQRENFA